jgi:alkanesulfonate monooxygenase SsuD/methylene tetrahydromethanopterin reductase-like flavin-dependent oxidoreductase (luciferase family)
MLYGLDVINAGYYADPHHMIELAQAAESSGWDGFFIWDHLAFVWDAPSGDPWVILSAVAASTKTIKISPAVTPTARRRPQVLAQHLTTLDHLSHGRVIFGAGLGGVPEEFTAFGQPFEAKRVAAMLDEGLVVIDKLWSGEPVTHHGTHYTVEGVTFQPKPMQQPRIPIWIGGESKPAMRRAARWDGWIIGVVDEQGAIRTTPAHLATEMDYIQQYRHNPAMPFDVAVIGNSQPGDGKLTREYADAGVTWWLDGISERRGTPDELLARVKAGPPK